MSGQTPNAPGADGIKQIARRLLASGGVGDEPLRRSSTILDALPVVAPGGELHSWFVPVTVGDFLAAFFQFLPDSTLMRFSSFQPGEIAACPAAADWLDPDRIQARAGDHCQTGEAPGEPFLTYDRTPDRLVWAVPLLSDPGGVRIVYVAGETVYEPSSEGTTGRGTSNA